MPNGSTKRKFLNLGWSLRGALGTAAAAASAGATAAALTSAREMPPAAQLIAGVGAASLVGSLSAFLVSGLNSQSRPHPGAAERADHASGALAQLEALEHIKKAIGRKAWADAVATALPLMTGAAGCAVLLRAPGADSLMLAGATFPLVIRALDSIDRSPLAPGRRAMANGQPVAMASAELPAWAAAHSFETGVVFPIPLHGQAIGLAYVLGKPWQSPSEDAIARTARFLELAATHYAIAGPFVLASQPRPDAGSAPVLDSDRPGKGVIPPAIVTTAGPAGTPSTNGSGDRDGPDSPPATRRRLDLSGVTLDPRTERCIIDGTAVALSRTEFDVLYTVALHEGGTVPTDALVRAVWGDTRDAPSSALDVTIHRVRRKIGRVPGGLDLIRTVRGKGYALALRSGEEALPQETTSSPTVAG